MRDTQLHKACRRRVCELKYSHAIVLSCIHFQSLVVLFNRDCSVEYIAEVVFVKQFLILLVGNTEAIKHVVDVGFAE